jgi:AcrR family transcriptional regulator
LGNAGRASNVREQYILDAAAALIIRQGYDKTTMSDVAAAAGIGRGVLYLHFAGKDKLFEALVHREMFVYGQAWLDHIEADPRGGTIGGIYRAVLHAIKSRPLMQAMMRRDRHVFGNYLRKPDNLFAGMKPDAMWVGTLRAMQAVGAVRKDVDVAVMATIMDMMSYGMISITDLRDPDSLPSFDVLMETMADMMDRLLTPEDGGNSEGGKAFIRQLAETARAQFGSPGGLQSQGMEEQERSEEHGH